MYEPTAAPSDDSRSKAAQKPPLLPTALMLLHQPDCRPDQQWPHSPEDAVHQPDCRPDQQWPRSSEAREYL